MTGSSVDTFARLLAATGSRRAVTVLLRVLTLSGALQTLDSQGIAARRKHKKHKRHAPTSVPPSPPSPTPPPDACPAGTRLCEANGACTPVGQCCADAECPAGAACCGGVCVDVAHDTAHCGGCAVTCSLEQTCVNGDCCLPRESHCDVGHCCGTDVCLHTADGNLCTACAPVNGDCSFDPTLCCPGLFCVDVVADRRCVTCVPEGDDCQLSSDCCVGLYCPDSTCVPIGPH
jgi:hypothetical protein